MSSRDDAIEVVAQLLDDDAFWDRWDAHEVIERRTTSAAEILDAAHDAGLIYWADELHDTVEHVILFTENDWRIEHPLAERLNGSLFHCHWNERCADLDGPPPEGAGRYIAVLESGVPIFRRVGADDE